MGTGRRHQHVAAIARSLRPIRGRTGLSRNTYCERARARRFTRDAPKRSRGSRWTVAYVNPFADMPRRWPIGFLQRTGIAIALIKQRALRSKAFDDIGRELLVFWSCCEPPKDEPGAMMT